MGWWLLYISWDGKGKGGEEMGECTGQPSGDTKQAIWHLGSELKGKVRDVDINLDDAFILMVFRVKRLDKINQGKTIDGKDKRMQNWESPASPTFSHQVKGVY